MGSPVSSDEDREKHRKRLKRTRSAIARELLTSKFRQRREKKKKQEDEDEERFRRFGKYLDSDMDF